jgi:hypothetical protein
MKNNIMEKILFNKLNINWLFVKYVCVEKLWTDMFKTSYIVVYVHRGLTNTNFFYNNVKILSRLTDLREEKLYNDFS